MDSYIEYFRGAVCNPLMQTKHGNIKTPNYNIQSNLQSKSSNDIAKAFYVSGFILVDELQLEALH